MVIFLPVATDKGITSGDTPDMQPWSNDSSA